MLPDQNVFHAMNSPLLLLADSGSTKTTWAALSPESTTMIHSQGISPYFLSATRIREVLEQEVLPPLGDRKDCVSAVRFYGTGLAEAEKADVLESILQDIFPDADISVSHDLLAAAQGLCGHTKGIACILGTGSGSCYFDGETIRQIRPGLGFILGDEGSGAFLGKRIVQHYLYGQFDRELGGLFEKNFEAERSVILDHVYKKPYPNRYLASFARFLGENRGHALVERILREGIGSFFACHLAAFAPEIRENPVHFTGGVAWAYRDVVESLCGDFGLSCGNVCKEPMEGLIRYHRIEMQNALNGKK